MSDEIRCQMFAAAAVANNDDEDDGRVCDAVEIQAELDLAQALVYAEIWADAASRATIITQLVVDTTTEVEGCVHLPTRLESQHMGSTPV
jgi:hypothetical protein